MSPAIASPLYFEAFLAESWKDGNRLGRHLFHDLKNRGYTGSCSNLERLLQVWRQAENVRSEVTLPGVKVSEPVRDRDTGHVISADAVAALCIKPRGLLTNRQARRVDALKQGSETFRVMRGLAMRFLFVVSGGENRIVNYRMRDNMMVVDYHVDRAVLLSGVGRRQDKITIRRGG